MTDGNKILVPATGQDFPQKSENKTSYLEGILTSVAKKKEAADTMGKGKKSGKEGRELALHCYDQYLNGELFYPTTDFEQSLNEQRLYRSGAVIPDELDLTISSDSGFYFGTTDEKNGYTGKPASDDGHILIAGTPGSGKTMGLVLPTLMTWRGSQVLIDVKGDLRHQWKKANSYHHKKMMIFSPGKEYSCCYDPFMQLRNCGEDRVLGYARDLALALIPLLPEAKDPVWIQTAQNFLTAAIVYYFDLGCSFVETMLAIEMTPVLDVIEDVMKSENEAAKVYMTQLQRVQDKVICNIGLELSNMAALVTEPCLLRALNPGDEDAVLDWSILNTSTEPVDIILEIPETSLDRWRPLVLLMLHQLIKTLEERPARTYQKETEVVPLLVMLDEFPRLGKITSIKQGLSTLRSRGVTFALVIQSIGDLEAIYGPAYSRVIADLCGFKAILRVADPASQKYFSDLVGTTVTMQRGFNAAQDPYDGRVSAYNRSISETREPILHPHEFLTLKDVVLITPYGFCRVRKTMFFKTAKYYLHLLGPIRGTEAVDLGHFSYAP